MLLMGMQNNITTLKSNTVTSYKNKHLQFYQAITLLGNNPGEMTIYVHKNIFI